jgi:hypothetical protein
MFGISPGGSQLGGVGNLGFFYRDPTTESTREQQPQKNPPSLESRVVGVCSLLVEFTGPGYTTNNGPGESSGDANVYGFGFTVSGFVADGAIGKVERTDANTGVPETDVVNAKGNWTIQQWGSTSFKLTGDKDPSKLYSGGTETRPDGPSPRHRMIEGDTFVYSDFPGLSKYSARAGNLTYGEAKFDFAVKVIDGPRQCEVKFQVGIVFRSGKVTANWGARP